MRLLERLEKGTPRLQTIELFNASGIQSAAGIRPGRFSHFRRSRRSWLSGRASGFEPETSCAQGRRNISWKSFLFNLGFENKRVRKIFDSGTMCGNVAPHAWSPPNFPHSEITAKVLRSFPPLTKTIWQHGVLQFVLVRPLPGGEVQFGSEPLRFRRCQHES